MGRRVLRGYRAAGRWRRRAATPPPPGSPAARWRRRRRGVSTSKQAQEIMKLGGAASAMPRLPLWPRDGRRDNGRRVDGQRGDGAARRWLAGALSQNRDRSRDIAGFFRDRPRDRWSSVSARHVFTRTNGSREKVIGLDFSETSDPFSRPVTPMSRDRCWFSGSGRD